MTHESIQVNLFTAGDSADINTWSNLPYFFSDALLKNGVTVNRFDLIPADDLRYKIWCFLWRKRTGLQRRLFGVRRQYDFFRDSVGGRLAQGQIRQAALRHHDADFNIFLTFSFSSHRVSDTPVIHLCDITYEHYLEDIGRMPTLGDRFAIAREVNNLRHAHLIYCPSQQCCKFIHERYGLENVRPFDCGVNLELDFSEPAEAWLECKWRSQRLLCIGRGIHKRGIDILIEAHAQLNAGRSEPIQLDLVGVLPQELTTLDRNVTCHGYLDKGVPDQFEKYTRLLREATLFVIPMRKGPRPGVVREAALAYTPVIISNIWDADDMVTQDQTGLLIDNISPDAFAQAIESLLNDRPTWERMAMQAHDRVIGRSWMQSLDDMLTTARELKGG